MSTFSGSIPSQRSETRLNIVVAVKIVFAEHSREVVPACTYEISLTGARIPHIRGIEAVDQLLWIYRKNLKARYIVVWIGEANTPQANQVGLKLMEPESIIWESEIKIQLSPTHLCG